MYNRKVRSKQVYNRKGSSKQVYNRKVSSNQMYNRKGSSNQIYSRKGELEPDVQEEWEFAPDVRLEDELEPSVPQQGPAPTRCSAVQWSPTRRMPFWWVKKRSPSQNHPWGHRADTYCHAGKGQPTKEKVPQSWRFLPAHPWSNWHVRGQQQETLRHWGKHSQPVADLQPKTGRYQQLKAGRQAPAVQGRQTEEYLCLVCGTPYTDPPAEDWIQCNVCEGWAHEDCTSDEDGL